MPLIRPESAKAAVRMAEGIRDTRPVRVNSRTKLVPGTREAATNSKPIVPNTVRGL